MSELIYLKSLGVEFLNETPNESGFRIITSMSQLFTKNADHLSSVCLCGKVIKTPSQCTTGLHSHAERIHKVQAYDKRPIKRKALSNKGIAVDRSGSTIEKLNAKYPMHALLARMTAKDGIPFLTFRTSKDLRDSIGALGIKKGFSDRLPQSEMTVKDYVMTYGSAAKEIVKEQLTQLHSRGDYLSATFDEWTSSANRRYMDITLVSNAGHIWNLGIHRIFGKADANNLLSILTSGLQDFGIDLQRNIVALQSDGASVMKKIRKISGVEHQLCLAHGIQLGIVDVLYKKKKDASKEKFSEEIVIEDEEISEEDVDLELNEGLSVNSNEEDSPNFSSEKTDCAIKKVRRLSAFFRRSSVSNEKLQDFVSKKYRKEAVGSQSIITKPLKVDVQTRWNSMYEMCQRYWEIHDCVDHALLDVPLNVTMTAVDKFIIWAIVNTLKPVALTVQALCRSDANLLTSRAALMLLFHTLEMQKESNPLSKAVFIQLKYRMKERLELHSGVLKYLSTGSHTNCYVEFVKAQKNVEYDWSEEIFPFIDEIEKNEIFPRETDLIDEISTDSLFEIPSNPKLKAYLVKLLSRSSGISANQALEDSMSAEVLSSSCDLISNVSQIKKFKSYQEYLDELIINTNASIEISHPGSSQLAKGIQSEMNTLQKTGCRGPMLEKCYNMLTSIKPTSVESERAFSSSAYICTKVKSRYNDDTLSTLCFLRALFRHENV